MRFLISVLGFCALTPLWKVVGLDTRSLAFWFLVTAPFFIWLDVVR